MKKITITHHPFKMALDIDDEWLSAIGVEESDIDKLIEAWDSSIKKMSILFYSLKAQRDASEAMKEDNQ